MDHDCIMQPTHFSGTAYGTVLVTRDSASFRVTEAQFPANASFGWHTHSHAHFCLVLEGAYVEHTGPGERRCEPSHLIFHPAGESHRNRISPAGARDLCVEILPGLLPRVDGESHHFRHPGVFREGPAVWSALRLLREFRTWDPFSCVAIEGLILETLAATGREQLREPSGRQTPGWLRQARQRIHDGPAVGLSLATLAEQAGVHPTHLARTFRQHYGCSVGEYIRRQRLAQACHALAATKAPLAEIALRAGYYDQAHFNKAFKQATGLTPNAFRRQRQAR
jgi:AraC family transcriptional regulator